MLSRILNIVLIMALGVSTYTKAQSYIEPSFYQPEHGLHLDFGFHQTIPTKNVLFPKWRGSDDPSHIKQTLTQEWNDTQLGGYIDLNYNLGYSRPFFIGFSFRWQTLYKDKSNHVRHLFVDEVKKPDIHWDYSKRATLFNYNIYGEYSFYTRRSLSLFARADIGLSHYNQRNIIDWRIPYQDTVKVKLNSNNDLALNLDLGLGFRWQFSRRAALRGHVGYQFQSPTNFVRSNYVEGLEASLNDNNVKPKDNDFSLSSIAGPIRPGIIQNEYLFFQLGVSFRLDGELLAEKPVLYLYPEDTTDVNVKVNLSNHSFAHSYPAYKPEGWNMIASPNGDLKDPETGRQYYTLFWETKGPKIANNLNKGFVVSGKETEGFLEEKLESMGLNFRELNEFMIYWLPQMENNEYNAVYFAFDEYEATSQLEITPAPDNVIRIMMLWEPLDEKITLEEQVLPDAPNRDGFTAVEWGGTKGMFFAKEELIQ